MCYDEADIEAEHTPLPRLEALEVKSTRFRFDFLLALARKRFLSENVQSLRRVVTCIWNDDRGVQKSHLEMFVPYLVDWEEDK